MRALFTKSWRRKAAIVALVLYALGISAPGLAMALTDGGAHCVTTTEAKHEAASHHHDHEATEMAADHHEHTAPAADDHGLTGKCCGSFCFTALAPGFAPFAEPMTQVSATPRPLVVQLLGHGSDPIDRPPRNLSPL